MGNNSSRLPGNIAALVKEDEGCFASPILNKLTRSPERQKSSPKENSVGWLQHSEQLEINKNYLSEVARLRMDAANLKANLSNEIFRLKKNSTG
jgi:hypothetical protein